MTRALFISLAALASLAATPSLASAPVNLSERLVAAETLHVIQMAQRQIGPSEAKAIALRRVNGKVMDIRRAGGSYIVRVLRPDNRIVDIEVDAATGRIRSVR